jgi:putative spermidine/putrescine transport system permease protein
MSESGHDAVRLLDDSKRLSLKQKFRAVQRRSTLRALALLSPLLCFLIAFYVIPIGSILYHAIDDPKVREILPRTSLSLATWDQKGLPEEAVYAHLVADLKESYKNKTLPQAGMRLNEEISGFRSLVMKTARKFKSEVEPPYKDKVISVNDAWADIRYWKAFQASTGPFTSRYLLSVVDLQKTYDGEIKQAPEERSIYVGYLFRTLKISFVVMLICCLLGYPMAFVVSGSTERIRRILLLLILVPFWVSLLVRTTSWFILLRTDGVVNDLLLWIGMIDQPLELIFNRFAVYVSLVHIMLPFMVLPIYSVMRGVSGDLSRAASSLGAKPTAAFLTVYFPQTLPGLGAGCILVFVITLGFYITPALVGGAKDQMLSYLIANFVNRLGNWSMASAVAILLLVSVILVLLALFRIFKLNRMRLI